jgi:hypothetical protein
VHDLAQLLDLVKHAEPRPRIIVGFPMLGHQWCAIYKRPDGDRQQFLLIGRGVYDSLKQNAGLDENASIDDVQAAALGIRVEFWNWTEHRAITREIAATLGLTETYKLQGPTLI